MGKLDFTEIDMSGKKPYSFVVTIEAKSEDRADDVRSEVVGGIEDLIESGEARGCEISWTSMEEGDQAQKLELYRALHDRMSDLVEDGKLQALKQSDPKAYEGLVQALEQLAGLDPKPVSQVRAAPAV